jgi:hypothetical protein
MAGRKNFRSSSRPPDWEQPAGASAQRRQQNRAGVESSQAREFGVSARAVGLPIDSVGAEAQESKRRLHRERKQGKKERCKCGRVAVVVKASITDGTTAWCLKCLEAGRQAESRKPREWARDWPEQLSPEENREKLEQKQLREETEKELGPGWKKGRNPNVRSIERSR